MDLHGELFRASPNAYMVVDRALRYLDANHAYSLLTGRPRDELLGRCLFDLFPGAVNDDGTAQADVVRASIERVFATGKTDVLALVPYTIATHTGAADVRYWSATHTPVRDASDAVVAVLQNTTDVTELQQLRDAVRRAREATGVTEAQRDTGVLSRAAAVQRDNQLLSARARFLTDLFAQAPGFMAVLRGPDHVFELANPAYEALVARVDLIGRPVREALPDIEGQGFFELLDQVRATGAPFVGHGVPVALDDGAGGQRRIFVDFIFQPIRDARGAVEGIFVQGSDATERETAGAALRDSELRFRTIANLVPQMVWSTRPDGYHDFYNQRWYDFTGVPVGSTDGAEWAGMFHPDDRDRAWARWLRSLSTGEPYEIEYRLRDASGQYQWVLGRALPVRDANGTIVRWMGTCTEIDELKRAQSLLQASQDALRTADRRKDAFLAMLAHELRNPLAPIANGVQLLRRAHDPDTVDAVRTVIERQLVHLVRLVDDLLDVGRITHDKLVLRTAPLHLHELLDGALDLVRPIADARGQVLHAQPAPASAWLHGDRVRLTQALGNVLHNALKFSPEGSAVDVEVALEGTRVRLAVIDRGSGVDPALASQLFELFQQAEGSVQAGGLGIGLALARRLVDMHGGRIDLHSDGAGLGTRVAIELPLADAPAPLQPTGAREMGIAPLRVLVVDDNLDAASTLALALRLAGHAVEVAHGGADALASVWRATPHVVLMDLGMPGMDGFEACRRLRATDAGSALTLIALSGYGTDRDRQNARSAGFDALWVKPVDLNRLPALLREVARATPA